MVVFRLYNIVSDGNGSHSLSQAALHSFEAVNLAQETKVKTTTTSGRTIKRPPHSEVYARTSFEGLEI